ncbi:MAG: hypothetical protein WCT31_00145 [Candidatus Micrarchaeia archaeon]|jgi:hypothetical protein
MGAGSQEAEMAFQQVTKMLFGKPLSPLSKYEAWLRENLPKCKMFATANGNVIMPDISIYRYFPEEMMAGLDFERPDKKLDISDPSFASLSREFGQLGKVVCELREGTNHNVVESNFYLNVQNSYRIAFCFHSKFCAHNIWSSFNERTFGCFRNMNGSFSINCYFSTEMVRCFEMDACKKCSDSMFCHNCEGLQDSLFCFNAKSLRYAVCNVEIGREKYLKIKKMLVEGILEELERTGRFELCIFNIMETGSRVGHGR